nr:hypothetical protein CFP56_21861 [Quercus suber]
MSVTMGKSFAKNRYGDGESRLLDSRSKEIYLARTSTTISHARPIARRGKLAYGASEIQQILGFAGPTDGLDHGDGGDDDLVVALVAQAGALDHQLVALHACEHAAVLLGVLQHRAARLPVLLPHPPLGTVGDGGRGEGPAFVQEAGIGEAGFAAIDGHFDVISRRAVKADGSDRETGARSPDRQDGFGGKERRQVGGVASDDVLG